MNDVEEEESLLDTCFVEVDCVMMFEVFHEKMSRFEFLFSKANERQCRSSSVKQICVLSHN
jgi:hypothetical protein